MSSSESKVNRYNQGFGKFGPMEQCAGGKWVLASDYLKLADRLLRQEANIKTLEKVIDSGEAQIEVLRDIVQTADRRTERLTELLDKKRNIIGDLAILTILLVVVNIAQFASRMLG